MHKLIRQKVLATHKQLQPEDQERLLDKVESSRKRGGKFLEILADLTGKLADETALNVDQMIKDGNPNVGTAIIFNEGYKRAMKEVHSWITID